MFTIILDDALDDVDICGRHPPFYRSLLSQSGLRSAFLDALNVLGAHEAGALLPPPYPVSEELSFLLVDGDVATGALAPPAG